MYYLIYTSLAKAPWGAESLQDLLERSRAKNARLNVTGMLLYQKGTFLQILEGPRAAVLELYNTIKRDPRHSDVFTIDRGEVRARSFPEWSMGFADMDQFEGQPGFEEFVDVNLASKVFRDDALRAKDLLMSFHEKMKDRDGA